MLFSNFGFRKYFVMPKMLYSVVILYYVIISVIIEKITLQYCGKTQCKLYHSNGAIVLANRRLVSISSRRGYLLIVEIDLSY